MVAGFIQNLFNLFACGGQGKPDTLVLGEVWYKRLCEEFKREEMHSLWDMTIQRNYICPTWISVARLEDLR